MRNILPFIFFLSLQLVSGTTFSQILYSLAPKQNAVSLTSGFDRNQPVNTLSFARGFRLNLFNKIKDDITLFVDVSDQTNLKTSNAVRTLYGGQGSLYSKRSFMLLFRKTFDISRYNLPNNVRTTYLGAELEIMPGIYKRTHFYALDIYYGDSFRGYLTSQGNGSSVLNEIGKGWFQPRQGTLRTGINVGYHLKSHWTFYGNVDLFVVRPNTKGAAYSPIIPFVFGYIGANYVFPVHKKIVEKKKG